MLARLQDFVNNATRIVAAYENQLQDEVVKIFGGTHTVRRLQAKGPGDEAVDGDIADGEVRGDLVQGKRVLLNGTELVAGDITLSSSPSWGTGRTFTIEGIDQCWELSITAGTSPGTNPTWSFSWKDGTFTTQPFYDAYFYDSTSSDVQIIPRGLGTGIVITATGASFTFAGTPTAGRTYTWGARLPSRKV